MKKKATKISKVKRSNQQRTKLSKQGKLKTRRHKKSNPKPKPKQVKPEEVDADQSDHGEDMLEMVEGDDLAYLKTAISQRSYQLLKKIRAPEYVSFLLSMNFKDTASYHIISCLILSSLSFSGGKERGPRKRRKQSDDDDGMDDIEKSYQQDTDADAGPKRKRFMLPIKTSKGLVTRVIEDDSM